MELSCVLANPCLLIPKGGLKIGQSGLAWNIDIVKQARLTAASETILRNQALHQSTFKGPFCDPGLYQQYPLWYSNTQNEEEKWKFYITSCSFCLCNSACSLQSLDHIGLRKWGLTMLGTGAYLSHLCPSLCNRPAPANPQTHLIMPVRCIKTL